MIAGHFNVTSGLAAFTARVTGISVAVLSTSIASGINHTSFSSTSTTAHSKLQHVSVVTVTDRTTVTETSCSVSSTSINTLQTASILPTSSLEDDIVKGIVPVTSSVPKTTSTSAVKPPGTTSLSSALGDQLLSQSTVVMITKTAWTTTWTSITAQPDAPASSPVKASHSSADKDSIGGKPQQPIDQVYAKPTPSSTITSIKSVAPVLTKSTTSCTSNGTASLEVAGKTPTNLGITSMMPTVHTALPVFGTAGIRTNTASRSPHPTPRIPIIPNIPFGHPPLFSNGSLVRNHTTLSSYHEKPTVHPGTASISTHPVSGSSTSKQAAKCTTTFPHVPTQSCTSTRYAHTKTITVDCYGCVGEQAQITKQAYHERKVRFSSIHERSNFLS